MKKLLSIVLLCTMLLSLAVVSASAADIDVKGRKNVCLDAGIFTYYEQFNMAQINTVDEMFDGKLDRIGDDGVDQNFGDFSMLSSAWTAFYNEGGLNGPRYNELGDEDPNGKYLTAVDFMLDDVYTVDTIRVFLDEMANINDLCVNGFDVLVRATEDDKWTTIYSVSNLATEAKYKVHTGA
ncbi:MAG: hypothetical protein II369_05185, partial [Clostridia bacterium]|nr:hypothetical protein [Clostridia bacterium]